MLLGACRRKAHVDEKHGAEPPKFKMEVVNIHGGDALLRHISEVVQIRETRGQMNRHEEWRQIQLRIVDKSNLNSKNTRVFHNS